MSARSRSRPWWGPRPYDHPLEEMLADASPRWIVNVPEFRLSFPIPPPAPKPPDEWAAEARASVVRWVNYTFRRGGFLEVHLL